MAGEETTNPSNIRAEYNVATVGLNMDQSVNQVGKGSLTYALNAAVENFDANSVNYQNEPGNQLCLNFPSGFHLIGTHFIAEQNKHIFFLANPETGDSQIGYMDNNDCVYRIYVNAPCLNFNINYPIHKAVHKITNCTTEIYWTDGFNPRRYLDLNNIPYILAPGSQLCDPIYTNEVDCNQLKVQPNFSIPGLAIVDIQTGGALIAGTYQFAIQYSDAVGNPYTSYYSVTNPTPIADIHLTTPNFNYEVGRSIIVNVTNLDVTGQFQYFNLAVIKTVNNITSVELAGTYFIDKGEKDITYTGQNVTQIKLTVDDIFEKFPYYEIAQDLTAVQDVLVWDNLTSIDRINYQQIANQIKLNWETYRIPNDENYSDELNATNLRGYLRDEVYAFEIVFLLKNGKQTDGFHIPGRTLSTYDLSFPDVPNTNNDFIGDPTYTDPATGIGYSPYWKIYNTASVIGPATGDPIGNATPYQYGEFAYWESTEEYPCNVDVWGELAGQKIRHHKFPDVLVSPIFESPVISVSGGKYSPVMQNDAIYPIGVRLDITQVFQLINNSNLTAEQKANIAAFKIVRGDRSTNKSIVGKGILRNVGEYQREGTSYYYANYPYNDLRTDPFLLDKSNAYIANAGSSSGSQTICRSFTLWADTPNTEYIVEYSSCFTNQLATITIPPGESVDICAFDFPKPTVKKGNVFITCNTYDRYEVTAEWAYLNFIPPNIFGNTTWTGGTPFTVFNWEYPHGTPPPPYATWIEFALANPTANSVSIVLNEQGYTAFNPSGYQVSSINIVGQNLGYTYYFDSINTPYWIYDAGNFQTIKKVASYGYDKCTPLPLQGFENENNKYRLIFNSPETSFGQPFLGNVLKLENVMYGAGRAHFTQVKKNAMYKLLSAEAQQDALAASFNLGGTDITSVFAAYQAYLTIYINGITRRNYAWSFNSIANYDYSSNIDNNLGVKQRPVDYAEYIIPAVQSVGDPNGISINNWSRESSVFLKTVDQDDSVSITYTTYTICNNTSGGSSVITIFNITDPINGVTQVSVNPSSCADIDSITIPVFLSGSINYTMTTGSTGAVFTSGVVPALPFPNETPSLINPSGGSYISDDSRFVLSDPRGDCDNPGKDIEINVVSYYASLKNLFPNQWGQIYSYETIDTGFQQPISLESYLASTSSAVATIFGGDTFISRFAFKTKLPFFIDNRVGAPDDSDIFYDEIGNVGYPTYWHSARSVLSDGQNGLTNFISVKAHNLDCPNKQEPLTNNPGRTYYDGKMYLFAYGIPNFYCESSINVDLRQAFNNREGDFWPHVSTGIPDDWLQESFVTILQDNTYYYNVTYSRQNKENFFSHLPPDWKEQLCYTTYPFRAIYSDTASDNADNRVNNWLTYRAIAFFDFPQNYGDLVSLDGIENKAILARFENKSLLYNTLLTVQTSNPKAAYLGNDTLFKSAPPIDFAETDLGYVGSQNKFLLKIPQGQITVDAKRGQVFLVAGNQVQDLSAFGSGMNRFFTDHLAFEILRYFPDVDVDNHFNAVGLHGVYDSKYDRVIISKLDYIPLNKDIKYDSATKEFYINRIVNNVTIRDQVFLTDNEYFCNKSWTLSFNINTKSWISFHSYIPNWYIAENNFFYSGLNTGCDLELIAATEVPIPPTTTTTSTTVIPVTTTSTTTITRDCGLTGRGVGYDCYLDGTAIDTTPTTTTTTSSTTSTTTTLCPCCDTYTLTNNTEDFQSVSIVSCWEGNPRVVTIGIPPNGSIHTCSCQEPVGPLGVTATYFGAGCISCFCYTVINTSYDGNTIQWLDCNGDGNVRLLAYEESVNICAKEGTIQGVISNDGLIILGGTTSCTIDGDCGTITTTTTTTDYCTTTTTTIIV